MGLRHQLDGAAIESAAALQMFLMHLREPLIPVRVQRLVLAENPGIPERIVASDALGLLRQDLSGRHLQLLTSLLDLLYVGTRNSPTNELQGCSLSVALLPIFFSLKSDDVVRWKQVAARFNELIFTAPMWLRTCGVAAARGRRSQPVNARRCRTHTHKAEPTGQPQTSVTVIPLFYKPRADYSLSSGHAFVEVQQDCLASGILLQENYCDHGFAVIHRLSTVLSLC
ncbi:uncharacterized protein [Periplaneta americana]|uniref:uncharacterized protein n=1 Tax=Periplaneta americana TaxID=6978 RepID=UPI0037E85CF9